MLHILVIDTNPQIQKAKHMPQDKLPFPHKKEIHPRHIILKFLKTENKSLESGQRGTPIYMATGNLEGQKEVAQHISKAEIKAWSITNFISTFF